MAPDRLGHGPSTARPPVPVIYMHDSTRRLAARALIALLALALMLVVLFLVVVLFGRVDGEEFAPDSFQRRRYAYYQLPIAQLPVTPISRLVSRGPLEKVLVDQNFITPLTPLSRWDFVALKPLSGDGREGREGDARILCRYLDALDEHERLYWLQWTRQHDDLARVFWPTVAELARRELYIFLPDLFRTAADAADPTVLRADLKRELVRNYERLLGNEVIVADRSRAGRMAAQILTAADQHGSRSPQPDNAVGEEP